MSGRDEERIARVALSQLAEPGSPRMVGLVNELGAVQVRDALTGERDAFGMRESLAARLAVLNPVRDLEAAAKRGIRFVIPGDDEWPAWIDDLAHAGSLYDRGGPPLGLWVRGVARLDELHRSVAVVGSRSSTTYGAEVAGEIAATVAEQGNCIVSGAAFGIDQAAHRGALAMGEQTVAVLACGADRAYPAAHAQLLAHIADHGAIVSESPPGGSPTKIRFLSRNRLIAALSLGTVVVEAAIRSGALSTATWTERMSRPVMGVPGPVTSETSAGVHELIRRGAATLVTRGSEVLEVVGASGDHLVLEPRAPERPRDRLRQSEAQVLDAVPVYAGASEESIARTAGMGLVDVRRCLEALHGHGFVRRGGQGWQLSDSARPR